MSFHIEPNYFKKDFFSYLESVSKQHKLKDGVVQSFGGEEKREDTYRKCKMFSFSDPAISESLYKLVSIYNSNIYGFDVWPSAELQYIEYNAKDGGHFDWHVDHPIESEIIRPRKFSMSVQLSNPKEYEGGLFQGHSAGIKGEVIDLGDVAKQKGTVITFPSYELHRVTPVTKGTRKVLVAWFHGPRWR